MWNQGDVSLISLVEYYQFDFEMYCVRVCARETKSSCVCERVHEKKKKRKRRREGELEREEGGINRIRE